MYATMELDVWILWFRRFWSKRVDALEQHLNEQEEKSSGKGKKDHEQP